MRLFQFSAPIQPGNSGGPVISRTGAVIGISTSILIGPGVEQPQNVNFATTATEALRFLDAVGIPHTLSENANSGDIVDHVGVAQQSTVLIFCLENEPATGPVEESPPTSDPILQTAGLDYLGFDYRTFSSGTVANCRLECLYDQRCTAFTFNTEHRWCFLKNDALVSARNAAAIGGILRWRAESVLDSGFAIQSDVDSQGGDYDNVRGVEFVECFVECAADARCRAFAYVRETQSCWLKDRVGQIGPLLGVDFGLR